MNGILRWSCNKLINSIVHSMFAVRTAEYLCRNAAVVTSTPDSQGKVRGSTHGAGQPVKLQKKGQETNLGVVG